MPGGRRAGAGRPPGAANKRTRAIADKAAKRGITPLEVLNESMRLLWHRATHGPKGKKLKRSQYDLALIRDACAVAHDAAPYMHPRLNAIQHTGKDGEPIRVTFTSLDAGAL